MQGEEEGLGELGLVGHVPGTYCYAGESASVCA